MWEINMDVRNELLDIKKMSNIALPFGYKSEVLIGGSYKLT